MTSTQEPRYPIIGRTIRSLREEAGLTQEALALEVKISKSEVSRLEKGKRNPKWETMKRLAKGLGVPCWHMVAKAEQLEAGASKEETLRSPPG